jgi:prepilin-type N-terminal cleavage/methylation domain-containing protein
VYKHSAAFSLVECLVVMFLVGVIAAFSVPAFQNSFGQQQYRLLQAQLAHAINFARIEAMSLNQSSQLRARVGGNWCEGWQVASHGVVIKRYPAIKGCKLGWQAFRGGEALTFLPTGATDNQNGRFTLRLEGEILWELLVSKSGRVRSG